MTVKQKYIVDIKEVLHYESLEVTAESREDAVNKALIKKDSRKIPLISTVLKTVSSIQPF